MNETLLCSDTDYETAEMIGSKMLMHMAMAYRMIKGDERMKLWNFGILKIKPYK